MLEINRPLAVLFSEILEDTAFAELQKDKEWYPGTLVKKFFVKLEKKGRPILRKQAGQAFGRLLLQELQNCYEWKDIRTAVACFPKAYSHFIRGDGAGVWISDELSEGFSRIRENTPFDCFFTEGMLGGLLGGLGARGAIVKHPTCRKDAETGKFCQYELIWMKSVL